MKNFKFIVFILVLTLCLNACDTKEQESKNNDSPTIEADYFGEKPPGLIPKLFAPKILSQDGTFEGGRFSPDNKEYYFSRRYGKYEKRTFFVIRYENNTWGNETKTDIEHPRFSRDGNIMYKGNKYRNRTDNGWSELKSMGPPFTDIYIMGISVSDKGTYYFDQWDGKDTIGAISYSRLINGKYESRQRMGKEINTGTWIAHPYIAPDESYLIWDHQGEGGYGQADIYISFRKKDGSWLPAINMGDKINTESQESGAYVTDDGKYLFFSRTKEKVRDDGSTCRKVESYWVDAQVIENLRPR